MLGVAVLTTVRAAAGVAVTVAVDGADVTALITVNPGAYTEFSEGGDVEEQRPFTPGGTTYTAVVVHAGGAWTVTSLEETPDAELPQA